MPPLELGLQHVHIDAGMNIRMVTYLDYSHQKTVLGDSPVFLRPAHMDGVNLEPVGKGIVGEGRC